MRFSFFVRSPSARLLLTVALSIGALVAASGAAADAATPAASAAVATAPAGVRTTITPGLKGWDTRDQETPTQISCLSAAGYSFDVVNTIGDMWQNEYNAAAAAGMKVVLFQGYDPTTWKTPSAAKARAVIVSQKAKTAKYPTGGQIFLNVEDNVNEGVTASAMLTWINNWAAEVRTHGFQPGVYVGVPQLLTVAQINSLRNVVFWRSASSSAPQAGQGFVVRQLAISQSACGISGGIDTDIVGTDSTGAQLVGAAFPKKRTVPTITGTFVPLTPTRLLDTRYGTGAPKAAVAIDGRIDLQVTGGVVPTAKATAVVLNVTATEPTADGFITVSPTGQPFAKVSNVNFVKGQTVANLVTVKVGGAGKVTLTAGGHPGTTQIVADIAGYYLNNGGGTANGTFTPVTPTRLLDTRTTSPAPGRQSKTPVKVTGRKLVDGSSLPAIGSIGAAVINLTAVHPTAAGSLTAYDYADKTTTPPNASNLNFAPGQVVPNLATVPVDPTTGQIGILNGSTGKTDLLADIAGYYSSGKPTATGTFVSISPNRILDTRYNVGANKPAANSAIALQITGHAGVPPTATAVVLNVTATDTAAAGDVTAFPSDRSAPLASNINFVKGETVANLVMVPIGADGKIILNNQSVGSIDLIGDVAGYFVG